jgi:hypothetical protein
MLALLVHAVTHQFYFYVWGHGPWKHGSYGHFAETVWNMHAIPENTKCGKVKSGFTELAFPHVCVILWQTLPVVLILNLCSLFFTPTYMYSFTLFSPKYLLTSYFWMKTKFNECELEYHNQYVDYAVGWTYEQGCDTDHSPHLLSRLRMSGSAPTCPICLHLVHRDNVAYPMSHFF